MWRHYTDKPLVIAGQAYWSPDEGNNFRRAKAASKLEDFLAAFTDQDFGRIAGLNWWHFGHEATSDQKGAMSPAMLSAITAADLGSKPYADV